jgi:hypothetical protein
VDTGQPVSMASFEGQPLIQMVTIDNAMPYQVIIGEGAAVSMMSLQVFPTLQIPVSSLIQAPSSQDLDISMEPHGSIVLPISYGVIERFRTILVNFHLVGFMLPYDAIITSAEHHATQLPPPSS